MSAHPYSSANSPPTHKKPDNSKVRDLQAEVDDVVATMKQNVNKALERDAKLNEIEAQTEDLRDNAKKFDRSSTSLKKKMCVKKYKMMFLCLFIFFIIILILVLSLCHCV